MTIPTTLEFVANNTPAISAAWLNGINDWVLPAYTSGTFVFNGASVTFAGTNGTTITFPSTSATIARIDAANTFTGTQTFAGLIDVSGAAAGQIKFPATQNLSADANTLDDYEEGTWTPVATNLTEVGGAATITGRYTKIGRIVYGNIRLVPVTNTSTIVGSTYLTLPIAPGQRSVCSVVDDSPTSYNNGVINPSTGFIYMPSWTTVTVPINISFFYEV